MSQRDDVSSTPGSKRTPAHCRTFALDIVKLYISLLAQFFTLSDVAVATASTAEAVTPTFLPIDSNSLTTCHFTSKILKEIVECASEIEGFAIASNEERSSSGSVSSTSEAKNVLKNFVESARWRFEEVICETWSKGECSDSTELLTTFYKILCDLVQMPKFSSISKHGSSMPGTKQSPTISRSLKPTKIITPRLRGRLQVVQGIPDRRRYAISAKARRLRH